MTEFRAIVIEQETEAGRILAHTAEVRRLTDALLMPGAVTIAVEYSGLNFKDGLAIAGQAGRRPHLAAHPRHRPGRNGRSVG